MHGDIGGLALDLQCPHQVSRHSLGFGDRHAGMNTNDLDVVDDGKLLHHGAQPPRRQDKRIAAGENDLPDFRARADIVERSSERPRRQTGRLAGADHFAPEAEPAIDRADVRQLEQYTIGITMHDAFDRAVRVVPDRIHKLFGPMSELRHVRNELTCNRIVRIVPVDQAGQWPGQGHGISCGNSFNPLPALGRHKTVLAKLRDYSYRRHDTPAFFYLSATGAQITWSIRCAPVASMISRSKPSAIPLAGGMLAKAARKSSSIG